MTQEIKTAIKSAEQRLEDEKEQKLKDEIYNYLKSELEAQDSIDAKLRKLNEERRVHEENIKNLKQGNLEAIEKRRQALQASGTITVSNWPSYTLTATTAAYYGNGSSSSYSFYSDNLAGTAITTASGKTYIF